MNDRWASWIILMRNRLPKNLKHFMWARPPRGTPSRRRGNQNIAHCKRFGYDGYKIEFMVPNELANHVPNRKHESLHRAMERLHLQTKTPKNMYINKLH